ncbi:MAG: DinB family protein [Phycisphaerales bacterium]
MPSHFAASVLPGAALSRAYADMVAQGIDDAKAGAMPEGVNTNHPTFVFGHLAIYPDRLFSMFGRADLAKPDERYEALFSPHAACENDPKNAKYPPFNEVAARYRERTDAILDFLKNVDDAALAEPNPNEQMRERFPTKGAQAAFMLQGHTMMHLGQVSAWRRMMGLGEALPRPQAPAKA